MLFGCIAASTKVNVVLTADGTDKGTERVCILETEDAVRCNQGWERREEYSCRLALCQLSLVDLDLE